jgi:hypothetical protein
MSINDEPTPEAQQQLKEEMESAEVLLKPHIQAARTIHGYFEEKTSSKAMPLVAALMKKQVQGEPLLDKETMLSAQALSLEAIFNHLAQKAAGVPVISSKQLHIVDNLLRLGLKAQSQCRATLETLHQIQNPFNGTVIKQQNVAYQQQVNNGVEPNPSLLLKKKTVPGSHKTKKIKNPTNELLEAQDEKQRLDTGTPIKTSTAHSTLETLETVNRP